MSEVKLTKVDNGYIVHIVKYDIRSRDPEVTVFAVVGVLKDALDVIEKNFK